MRLPTLQGVIKRRLLVNFRVDPEVMQSLVPAPFRVKIHAGHAIAGICLIRLEQIRPPHVPASLGLSSENAAHRVAVQWPENDTLREAVFIPRRDTGSHLNHLVGGRIFPGEHHLAAFEVSETAESLALSMASSDGTTAVRVRGQLSSHLPSTSCFQTVAEASAFFEAGSLGYSVTHRPGHLDGVKLQTARWHVEPFDVSEVFSSYFSSETLFPRGSILFDHALIMRNIEHEWRATEDLYAEPGAG